MQLDNNLFLGSFQVKQVTNILVIKRKVIYILNSYLVSCQLEYVCFISYLAIKNDGKIQSNPNQGRTPAA